jgi:hypothetical protein
VGAYKGAVAAARQIWRGTFSLNQAGARLDFLFAALGDGFRGAEAEV